MLLANFNMKLVVIVYFIHYLRNKEGKVSWSG